MLRLLVRPRWLALTLAVVLIAIACVNLGKWQLRRLDGRRDANAAIRAGFQHAPVPVDSLLRPGEPVPRGAQWRRVHAMGHYEPAREILVRNRSLGGRAGYYVLTPLVTRSGAVLLVNRGWVAAGATAATRPGVPPALVGEVDVVGRIRPSERASGHTGLPPGQVDRIAIPAIATAIRLPYPVYGGYAELTEQRPPPAAAPQPIPPPELSDGPHLAYAVQWFIFALMALGGWVLLFRRDLAEQRDDDPQPVADHLPAGI